VGEFYNPQILGGAHRIAIPTTFGSTISQFAEKGRHYGKGGVGFNDRCSELITSGARLDYIADFDLD